MQRIGDAVDKHDAILAGHAVGAACVQILNHEYLLARERCQRLGQDGVVLDVDEMPAGMKAGTSQQQRKAKIAGRRKRRARRDLDLGRNHTRYRRQAARIVGASGGAHPVRPIDDRRRRVPRRAAAAARRLWCRGRVW